MAFLRRLGNATNLKKLLSCCGEMRVKIIGELQRVAEIINENGARIALLKTRMYNPRARSKNPLQLSIG